MAGRSGDPSVPGPSAAGSNHGHAHYALHSADLCLLRLSLFHSNFKSRCHQAAGNPLSRPRSKSAFSRQIWTVPPTTAAEWTEFGVTLARSLVHQLRTEKGYVEFFSIQRSVYTKRSHLLPSFIAPAYGGGARWGRGKGRREGSREALIRQWYC